MKYEKPAATTMPNAHQPETLPRQTLHPGLMMQLLEPRIMFDAAVADAAVGAVDSLASDVVHAPAAVEIRAADPARDNGRKEAVLVDTSVAGYKALEAGVRDGVAIVEFDGRADGLAQIARWAATASGFDSISILSHGAQGRLILGATQLTGASLEQADTRAELARIGGALAADGDLLLYGCDIGSGRDGQAFVANLAALTGADVAASSNDTGAQRFGADWVLETQAGHIESALPLTADAVASYSGVLATFDLTGAAGDSTKVVTQTVGSDEIVMTAQDGNWLVGDEVTNIGSDLADFDGTVAMVAQGVGYESRVTITVSGGKVFDLSSLAIADYASEGKGLVLTSNKGGVSYSKSATGLSWLVSTTDTDAEGISWLEITTSDASGQFAWDFDNVILTNIMIPAAAPSLGATASNPVFTENASAVTLFSAAAAATNDGGQTFSGMTLTVTNVSNGANEILSIGGTDVALNNGNSGVLTGIGNFSVAVAGGTATVSVTGMTRDNTQMGTLVNGMTYRNTNDDPGNANRVVTITGIADSGSNNNTASPGLTSTVTVTPVNDAPVLVATATSPAYAENAAAADLFSGVTVSAIEAGQNIDQLTLTVGNLADGASEILRADGTDIALTHGASGATATNAMNYSVSVVAGTATVTLGKGAGIAAATAQTLVDGLSYRNASDAPTVGNRVVTLTGIRDMGGGSDTTTVSFASTVTVSASNDVPSITAPGSIGVTEDVASALTGVSFADADAGGASVTATLSVASGTLAATSGGGVTVAGSGTTSLTLTGSIANLNTFIAGSNVSFTTANNASSNVTLNVGVDDGGNTGGGAQSASTTCTLSVSAVNDAPAVSAPATIAVTEDVAAALTGISFSDVDAGAGSVTATLSVASGTLTAVSGGGVTVGGSGTATLTLTGTIANLNTFIAGSNAAFTTALNATGNVALTTGISDGGNTGSGGAQSASQGTTLLVSAANDAPTLTNLGGDAQSFSIGGGAIKLDLAGNATVADVDSSDFNGGNVTVAVTANGQAAEDVLSIENQGSGAGQIGVSGGTVSYGGTVIGTAVGGTGGANLVISLNANATPVAVQALVRALTYLDSDAGTVNTATRTVRITVNDGGATSSNQDVTVTLVRAPILDLDTGTGGSGASVGFTEGGGAVAVTGTPAASDDGTFKSLTVTLTNRPDGVLESLSSTFGSGAQTVNGEAVTIGAYNNGSGVLTVTVDDGSTSAATLEMLMASIRYSNTSATPATASRSITFAATDNDNNTGSSVTSTVSVTAVNDAPGFSAGATLGAVAEDTTAPAGATVAALLGANFTDPDGNLLAGVAIAGEAANPATQGKWQYSTNGGTNWYDVSASAVSTSNALLVSSTSLLRFLPVANYNGTPGALTVFAVDDSSATVFSSGSTRATFDTTADGATSKVSAAGVSLDTSVSAAPDIVSATYDASTGVLVVTGNDFAANGGGADVDVSLLTLAGEGGATCTLTTAGVEITSDTSFSVTLNATDRAAVNQILNKNGTSATGGAVFGLSAADDYITAVTVGDSADANNGVTVSGVAAPALTSATYDANTGTLVVTGTGFLKYAGAANDIVANAFTLTGEGGATCTLTDTASVELTSGTQFTLVLSATDRAALAQILNKNGTTSTSGTLYNLAAAEDWAAGADAAVTVADLAGNGITVSNSAVPAITSATYNAGTGTLTVTGTGFLKLAGATNDIDVSKLTLSGEGGSAFTLTSPGVELTDSTHFTVLLNATDKAAVNALLNKAGTSSTGGTVYNLAAAENWAAGADAAVVVADLAGNGITVAPLAALITNVSASGGNGPFGIGDVVTLSVTFDQTVTLDTSGGTPTLLLETGATDRVATYVSGSGSTTLNFTYVVQEGDVSADLDYTAPSALLLNGATAGSAVLTLPAVGSAQSIGGQNSIVVDGIRPTATISVADNALSAGETSLVTITFSESVTGLSAADFAVANGTLSALNSSDGGITWTATFTPAANAAVPANRITLDNAGVTDAAGNPGAGTTQSNAFAIDSQGPLITSVGVPSAMSYKAGDVLRFVVNTDENVVVDTAGGVPRLALDIGGTEVFAHYVAGSGTTALVFEYTVQTGQNDGDGIAIGQLHADGGTLRDAAGNPASLNLNGVGSTAGVSVDTVTPTALSLSATSDSGAAANTVTYTLVLAENVSGVDASDFGLVKTGSVEGRIERVTTVDGRTYAITVSGISGVGSMALSLAGNGTGIVDAAGNALTTGAASAARAVDTSVPPPPPPPPVVVVSPPPLSPPTAAEPDSGSTPFIVLTALSPTGTAPASPLLTGPTPLVPVSALPQSSGLLGESLGTTFVPPVPTATTPAAPVLGGTGVAPASGVSAFVPVAPASGTGYVATGDGMASGSPALVALPSLGTQMLRNTQSFSISLPPSTFVSSDPAAELTVEVRQRNGTPLPAWVRFDPGSGTFSGRPPPGWTRSLLLEVIARDSKGHRASTVIELDFRDIGQDAPILPLDPGAALPAAPSDAAAHEPAATGRAGLDAQFARFGRPAQQAEQAALYARLVAAASDKTAQSVPQASKA